MIRSFAYRTQEVAVSEVVRSDVVLHVNAARAVNGDAPAERVPDGVRPDEGVRPVRVDVQGHVEVHRVRGEHEHLQTNGGFRLQGFS